MASLSDQRMHNFSMNSPAVDHWEFLNSGFHSGHDNMQLDGLLAERLRTHGGSPTLRVYGWKPYAISLGYNQRDNDFDIVRCAAQGIDLVRRPTGGRAILHAEELTYSVTMFSRGKSINDAYSEISRALLSGLRLLGADAEYAEPQTNLPQLYRSRTSIPCFANSTRYEIQYQGRKLVGSAQRRFAANGGDEVVLQHGSILLGAYHKRLSEFVKTENEETRAALRQSLEAKTIELDAVLGRTVSFDEAAFAVKKGFEKTWNVVFTEITADELHPLQEIESAVNN